MNRSFHSCLFVASIAICSIAMAQDDADALSSDDIVKALDPPKTRSLTRGIGVTR